MIKRVSFSVQTIEFVFKRSNFNLNEAIRRRHLTTAHRPQRRAVVQVVAPGSTWAQRERYRLLWPGGSPATSAHVGGSAPRAGATAPQWNQP
jgi:hypothetical protein